MTRLSPWERLLAGASVAFLAISGLGQMPIFKRYYVADLPGMAWTANYYLLHKMHYLLAIVLMLLVASRVSAWLAWWRARLRPSWLTMAQPLVFAGVVLTGLARTVKNLPEAGLSPGLILAIDLGHLLFAVLLGLLALLALVLGQAQGRAPREARRPDLRT